jgi:hypothetical protein
MVGFGIAKISLGDIENHPPDMSSIKRLPECQRRNTGLPDLLICFVVVEKEYYAFIYNPVSGFR